MSTILKGLVYFGTKEEDSNDIPFIWGSLMSKAPKDADGKLVKNPGSFMIYGAKGKSNGDCEEVLLKSRGIAGLYDLIPADKHELILRALGLTISEVPEIPVIEAPASSTNRAEAREKARAARQARRGARTMQPQTELAEQPE